MTEHRIVIEKALVVGRLIRTRFDRRARDADVTLAQWRTIASVRAEPGLSQRRVADMLEVTEVTAGRLIDKLCEQGWVERRPDPHDRRANRLYLTEAADPLLERLEPIAVDEEERTFGVLTPAELTQLRLLLTRVAAHLETSA